MKPLSYEFADGARFQAGANRNPDKVGNALERIRGKNHGQLRPRDVVDEARNPKHVLHNHFEWDDGLAADEHRLEQARRLIRAVVAVYELPEPTPVRAFISIPADGYSSLPEVFADPTTREAIVERALKEAEAWRKRYEDLHELKEIFKAIEVVTKEPA